MTIAYHAVGAAYVKVADAADATVVIQATGTAGLRVCPGTDGDTPAASAAGFLLKFGNVLTRDDITEGAIYAKSALENRASQAAVEIP